VIRRDKEDRQSKTICSISFFREEKVSKIKTKKKEDIKLFGGAMKNVLEKIK
jgi:hypothetical protein